MIHLLDKVYLAADSFITSKKKAVVISTNSNLPISSLIQNRNLVFYVNSLEQAFADFDSRDVFQIITKLSLLNESVIVYCDKENFGKILMTWYKGVFQKYSNENSYNLYKSALYRYNIFFKNNQTNNGKDVYSEFLLTQQQWESLDSKTVKIKEQHRIEFLSKFAEKISVEFLLASYISNTTYKDHLKKSIQILIKKDLEKYLFELKEILLVHMLKKSFIEKFQLKKDYNFENFTELMYDEDPTIRVFFDKKIWKHAEMFPPSSGKNINFTEISNEDIKNFKRFNEFAAGDWQEEAIYKYVKSDVNKLDFVSIIKNFTDESLDKLLKVEATFTNSAGSFFSIDLVTVNHYFINALFEASTKGNKKFLENYTI